LPAQSFSYNTNDWLSTDAYDANGSTLWTTNSGTATGPYAYDVENRLIGASNGAVTIVYDGDGTRVQKTVGTNTTYYVVDDRNPSGYAQVVEELTNSGGTPSLSRVYCFGLQLISQRLPSASTNYFIFDGHGSTRALADSSGRITDSYQFDAFGILLTSTGSTPNNYLYCGEQFDANLSTYYLRARCFHPETGRYWTEDEDGHSDQEEPKSLHNYLYCEADPVSNTDPSGHEIGGMLAVMDIGSTFFSLSSPGVTAVLLSAGVGISRPLTDGEINAATSIFGSKIEYSSVKVYRKKAYFFQPKDVLMTPDGNIYANPSGTAYSSDYSAVSIYPASWAVPIEYTTALFIHEMTHVWQFQSGMNVKTRAIFNRAYNYRFSSFGKIPFLNYGVEKQAQIVGDYYLLRSGHPIFRNNKVVQNPPSLQTYQKVISPYFP
jgi:RHS repeat-associated protein